MSAKITPDAPRMYDMRHHAIIRLAEKAPEQVILKIAGHVSPQMLKNVYSHVRDAAVREAIDSLSRPDGWKPNEATVRKLMPRVNRFKVVSIARKAREIVAETAPEDTSWILHSDGARSALAEGVPEGVCGVKQVSRKTHFSPSGFCLGHRASSLRWLPMRPITAWRMKPLIVRCSR